MSIPFHFPQFQGKDPQLTQWISGLINALQEIFGKMESQGMPAGTLALWDTTVAIPAVFLICDGTEYDKSVSPALYKLLGESSPGKFAVPTLTGVTDTYVVIRV